MTVGDVIKKLPKIKAGQKILFIDDSEKSLETAKELGYAPILFESYDQLREELQKLTGLNL